MVDSLKMSSFHFGLMFSMQGNSQHEYVSSLLGRMLWHGCGQSKFHGAFGSLWVQCWWTTMTDISTIMKHLALWSTNELSASDLPTYDNVRTTLYIERNKSRPPKTVDDATTITDTASNSAEDEGSHQDTVLDHLKLSQLQESEDRKNKSKAKAIPTSSKVPDPPSSNDSPRLSESDGQTQPEPEIIPSIISQVVITEKMFNDLYKTVCNSSHDVTVFLAPNLKLVIKKDIPDNGDTTSEQPGIPDNGDITPDAPLELSKELPSDSLLEPNIIIKEEIVEIEESLKYDDTYNPFQSSSTGEPSTSEKIEQSSSFTENSCINQNDQMEWTSNLSEPSYSCSSDKIKETYHFSDQNSRDSKSDWTSNLLEPNSCGSSKEIKSNSSSSEQNEYAFSFSKKHPSSSPEQCEASHSSLLKPSSSYSSKQIAKSSKFSRQESPSSTEQINWTSNLMKLNPSGSFAQTENMSDFSKQNVSLFSEQTEHNRLSVFNPNSSYLREKSENNSSCPKQNFGQSRLTSEQSSLTCNLLKSNSSSSPELIECSSKNNFAISSEQIERTSNLSEQNVSFLSEQTE